MYLPFTEQYVDFPDYYLEDSPRIYQTIPYESILFV